MIEKARSLLKDVFGYDHFRPLQAEVIANLLRRNDTLVIMPTGGGKSLCYQIPALIFEGLTVVVSPLISLMKDQVGQLTELGIPAVVLNSSLSAQAYRHNVQQVRENRVRLLYMAPETLLRPGTLNMLAATPPACLSIDEAHCISQWGHDFRPEYRRLTEVRERFPQAACLALTATATPRVRQDIAECLRFSPDNAFISSFDRKNLLIRMVPKRQPFQQTIEFLKKFPDQSGIIYCLTRRQVDELHAALKELGFSVRPYHAGLNEAERSENQERFIRDDIQIIVATVAFGMGIDKPNIRFVLHYDLPKNIEGYYQEIGRAGRDGLPAECLLLFRYGDTRKIRYFIDQKEEPERQVAYRHLNALVDLAETGQCRRIPLLAYFGETFGAEKCDMCDNCLGEGAKTTDLTIPVQKFLSCVRRTGEIFGAAYVTDVLRGSRSQKITGFGHQNLSTYGIGKDLSKAQWQQVARLCLRQKLMVRDPQYGSLKLTPKAWAVFRGKEKVSGRLRDDEVRVRAEPPAHDSALFEILRDRRKALADAADVPPYAVFPDKTLIEMASFFPRSPERLMQIHGVGRVKHERYGAIFLEIIDRYCREKNIKEKANPRSKSAEVSPISGWKQRHEIIGEAFVYGRSVSDLMGKFNIKRGTVIDHLCRYVQKSGYTLSPERLAAEVTVSASRQKQAAEAFERLGADLLKPVFEELGGDVTYEDLKLLRLCYLMG
ncbi:ATP-dependent DNA helicase RecQ [Desulfonema ishimotonii]|uniref:DNA helicase RecQ n=1 Tax=Desulfonema ishimotonii TaxID=45657 RepID=A0A401G147_9BACT|nr:DNA helicase RecQ [Desulfonema ishimotonii]GBC62931.1 ATP-dependent DNA helicase RecQ [Desulfonema ishimotonii]